jgi:hypothetical protein
MEKWKKKALKEKIKKSNKIFKTIDENVRYFLNNLFY